MHTIAGLYLLAGVLFLLGLFVYDYRQYDINPVTHIKRKRDAMVMLGIVLFWPLSAYFLIITGDPSPDTQGDDE